MTAAVIVFHDNDITAGTMKDGLLMLRVEIFKSCIQIKP